MKAGIIHILDLDFEFKLWKNRLLNYQSEITILFERIKALEKEHPGFLLSKNKLKLLDSQNSIITNLLNEIETLELEMALYAEDYPINEKHSHYIMHEVIRKEVSNAVESQREILHFVYPELCYPVKF